MVQPHLGNRRGLPLAHPPSCRIGVSANLTPANSSFHGFSPVAQKRFHASPPGLMVHPQSHSHILGIHYFLPHYSPHFYFLCSVVIPLSSCIPDIISPRHCHNSSILLSLVSLHISYGPLFSSAHCLSDIPTRPLRRKQPSTNKDKAVNHSNTAVARLSSSNKCGGS